MLIKHTNKEKNNYTSIMEKNTRGHEYMRNIKKKIIFLFITLSMMFILVGCGTVKISSDTTVSMDGRSNTSVKVYYDDSINKIVNNDLLSSVINELEKNLPSNIHFEEVNKSKDGDLNIEEVNVVTDKIKINELEEMNTDEVNIEVDKNKGLFSNIYKVTIKLNNSAINVISDYINTNINDRKKSFRIRISNGYWFNYNW